MNRDDPPTTITGILTGEDPKPLKPRFVRAVLRCAFLAAPMLCEPTPNPDTSPTATISINVTINATVLFTLLCFITFSFLLFFFMIFLLLPIVSYYF